MNFKIIVKERGIVHITGAPYHAATNGAAERLIQTFKQALRKSAKPAKQALLEFLIQYRRTPTGSGYSPSQLLNNRQIRTKLDTLVPSPPHIAQGKQSKETVSLNSSRDRACKTSSYKIGESCYAMYCGPRRNRTPRWVPAKIIRVHGSRTVTVKVLPRGPIWCRYVEQLRPRHASTEDEDPGEPTVASNTATSTSSEASSPNESAQSSTNVTGPTPSQHSQHAVEYSAENPRRSTRVRKPTQRFCC